MSHLDHKLSDLLVLKERLGRSRRDYLENLKEILDLYVLSVMEEEDPLYSLLHQRSEYVCNEYKNLKTLAPFCIQIRILMTLPFQHNQVEVEKGVPGYVKLKLPANVGAELTSSRVWRDACNRGIQKSLLRHINSWRDENNYLKSPAFLKWFGNILEKSLELTGSIPNYHIQRAQSAPGKVILNVDDLRNNFQFAVVLLPVLSFPVSQLPGDFIDVPRDPSCTEWMAECRSNEVSNEQFWGISLWQHERLIIKEKGKLKPVIYALKSLRDGCGWHLNNYQLRTLVMLTYKENSLAFATLTAGELVLHLLLELRNRLVSREGLPFLWDDGHNLLCGLTGQAKSGLARAVTQTRESLQNPDTDFGTLFRPQVYKLIMNPPNDSDFQLESAPSESPTSSMSLSELSAPASPSNASPSTSPAHQPQDQVNQVQAQGQEQPQPNIHRNEGFEEYIFSPRRLFNQAPPPPRPSGLNGMRQDNRGPDWWTVGVAGAGALAFSVLAGAGYAMARRRNQQT